MLGAARRRRHGRRAAARRARAPGGRRMTRSEHERGAAAARAPIRSRPPRRRRCGRAGSTSSSASRACSEHLEIMLDRGASSAARPSTTCCSRVRPASARRALAGIIATEMGARLRITSGPALERAGDLAAILTNLDDGDVLFIDEIHRLPRVGRGGALSRDGGLPARHRDRQGPVGARRSGSTCRASRSSAPRRAPGSSPGRCATASASSPASTTTTPTSSPRSSRAPRRILGVRSTPTAPARSRGAPAARRASPTGC